MNKDTLGALLMPDEQVALAELTDGLIADVNARLKRVSRILGLKKTLDLFDITVVGLHIAVEVDDETRAYLLDRRGEVDESSGDEDTPNYYS